MALLKPNLKHVRYLLLGVSFRKACAEVALGEAPTPNNVALWVPMDKPLDIHQERVLDLLQAHSLPVKSYASAFIGREHFHTAHFDDITGKYSSPMGTSHLKVDFQVMLEISAANPVPQPAVHGRYGILTDILELQGDMSVLLDVTWFKVEATFVDPLTKNVHVLTDYVFDPTSEPIVEACSITNQVVIVDLPLRPLDLAYRTQLAVLDREFVGVITRPITQ